MCDRVAPHSRVGVSRNRHEWSTYRMPAHGGGPRWAHAATSDPFRHQHRRRRRHHSVLRRRVRLAVPGLRSTRIRSDTGSSPGAPPWERFSSAANSSTPNPPVGFECPFGVGHIDATQRVCVERRPHPDEKFTIVPRRSPHRLRGPWRQPHASRSNTTPLRLAPTRRITPNELLHQRLELSEARLLDRSLHGYGLDRRGDPPAASSRNGRPYGAIVGDVRACQLGGRSRERPSANFHAAQSSSLRHAVEPHARTIAPVSNRWTTAPAR